MKRGLTLPIFDELANPALLAQLAREAEEAGLDGVFVWDHVRYRKPVSAVTDPWIALAAIACNTTRIAIGPMVTPLARRRPVVVARQVAALDHLSGGRMILGTGLGLDSSGGEFAPLGEEPDTRVRAEMYDEALVLLRALLSGGPVDVAGAHFQITGGVEFLPTPVQQHLPIWVAGRWPHRRPLLRASGQDGVFVIDLSPAELADVRALIAEHRPNGLDGFDIVVHAPAGTDSAPWEEAGATWCLTTFDPFAGTADAVRQAIRD